MINDSRRVPHCQGGVRDFKFASDLVGILYAL
jgi:hypothetical protein